MTLVRRGECTHCGWCCQTLGKAKGGAAIEDPPDVEYVRTRGFREMEMSGRRLWIGIGTIIMPCPQHKENRCDLYPGGPHTCRTWPVAPEQVEGTPCTYRFEEDHD